MEDAQRNAEKFRAPNLEASFTAPTTSHALDQISEISILQLIEMWQSLNCVGCAKHKILFLQKYMPPSEGVPCYRIDLF